MLYGRWKPEPKCLPRRRWEVLTHTGATLHRPQAHLVLIDKSELCSAPQRKATKPRAAVSERVCGKGWRGEEEAVGGGGGGSVVCFLEVRQAVWAGGMVRLEGQGEEAGPSGCGAWPGQGLAEPGLQSEGAGVAAVAGAPREAVAVLHVAQAAHAVARGELHALDVHLCTQEHARTHTHTGESECCFCQPCQNRHFC